jgi:hypothetical protein
MTRWMALLLVLASSGCAAADRAFPLRDPMTVDTDLLPVTVACRASPTPKEPHHISCAPDVYVSPLIWDGTDNMLFRPLSEAVGIVHHGEAVNVTSLDEVPDSAWFTNRIGANVIGIEGLVRGACKPAFILDPDGSADGTWLIDHGKTDGSWPGFRVNVPGKGKYLFEGEPANQPEHPSAASAIGAAVYAAVGFNTSCEQIVYFRPFLLKLAPGLQRKGNFGAMEPFDQKAVDKILADAPHRGDLVRMQASAWLPGYLIGPFSCTGTRPDGPNDIIPHDDRRELRGGRLWDRVRREPGLEIFGFFNLKDFEPDEWKNEYPNAAFSRMTERDGAWMARIPARFTPEIVGELGRMAKFSDPRKTAYLTSVLEGSIEKILQRYLTRMSPFSDVHVSGTDRLCAEDLAGTRHLRPPADFRSDVHPSRGTDKEPLPVTLQPDGAICITLPYVAAEGGRRGDDAESYVRDTNADGVARGPLVAHLYDLGPTRGYRLAGLERSEP